MKKKMMQKKKSKSKHQEAAFTLTKTGIYVFLVFFSGGCVSNGQSYDEGETLVPYPNDPCFWCICENGQFQCAERSEECPPVECDNAITDLGKSSTFISCFKIVGGGGRNLLKWPISMCRTRRRMPAC